MEDEISDKIKPEDIENDIVRRALERRSSTFLFNYTEKSHNDRGGYSEWKNNGPMEGGSGKSSDPDHSDYYKPECGNQHCDHDNWGHHDW